MRVYARKAVQKYSNSARKTKKMARIYLLGITFLLSSFFGRIQDDRNHHHIPDKAADRRGSDSYVLKGAWTGCCGITAAGCVTNIVLWQHQDEASDDKGQGNTCKHQFLFHFSLRLENSRKDNENVRKKPKQKSDICLTLLWLVF